MKSFVFLLLASFFSVCMAIPVPDDDMNPIDKSVEFVNDNLQGDDNMMVRTARQIYDNINVDISNGLLI